MSNVYGNHKVAESSLFLKLVDGQTQTIRITTEPYIFQSKFERIDKSTGEKEVKWSTRYAWVIFNRDTMKAQVLQLSPTTFKQIQGLAMDDNWGDPVGYDIKISRSGSGTDTIYTIVPVPNKTPISEHELKDTHKLIITDITGLAHALPLSQVTDGNDAPKPAEDRDEEPQPKGKDVVLEDIADGPVNLDEIPFG